MEPPSRWGEDGLLLDFSLLTNNKQKCFNAFSTQVQIGHCFTFTSTCLTEPPEGLICQLSKYGCSFNCDQLFGHFKKLGSNCKLSK